MVVVVATLKAMEGKEAELEKALLDMIPKVKEEEGTLVYTLHRDQNDPKVFMFYEKYKDMDALMAHSMTDHFKELFKTIKPILAAHPDIKTLVELGGIN